MEIKNRLEKWYQIGFFASGWYVFVAFLVSLLWVVQCIMDGVWDWIRIFVISSFFIGAAAICCVVSGICYLIWRIIRNKEANKKKKE